MIEKNTVKKGDTFSYKGWLISDSFIKRSLACLWYNTIWWLIVYLILIVVILVVAGLFITYLKSITH